MRKLKLESLKTFKNEEVGRSELATIFGGSDGGSTCGSCKERAPGGGMPYSCFDGTGTSYPCLCVYRKAGESGC